MATGCPTLEELLVNLQRQQEADAEENRKAFLALHEIMENWVVK